MDSDSVLTPHRLYQSFVETGERRKLVERLWGRVPANLGEACQLAADLRSGFKDVQDGVEELKKAMKHHLRRWGLLTSRVEDSIDGIEGGVIETGQQPMCLGGPSYILNKAACIRRLCDVKEPGMLTPLFYVADYDGAQSELLNIRVPSPSPKGLLISLPIEAGLFGCPIYELPRPPEAWFKEAVERIRGDYRGLLKGVDRHERERGLQNLDHALTILRSTYHSSENVSDWSVRTLGSLINLEADLGVPILPFSMQGTRRLFQRGYELLLSEPNRSRFIEASNRAAGLLVEAGYRPQIGPRADDYVPFFLECMNDSCRRRRIELKYRRGPSGSEAHVVGKCPSCGEEYDFSFRAHRPDLSEVMRWISPRVDSRQIIVDSLIPILCHVGGPGETSYYAEVIPAARGLKVPFPIFFRYTRTFYNTPWSERISEGLKKRGEPTLTDEGLFNALRRWVEARNARDSGGLAEAHREIRRCIEATYKGLLAKSQVIAEEIDDLKRRLRRSEDRAATIRELQSKQRLSHAVDLYLSHAFGRFSPERFGQEVSWAWLDLAAASGVGDLMGVYLRQYSGHTPNSSMFFVNL